MSTTLFQPFSLSVIPDRAEVSVAPAGELDMTCAGDLEAEVERLLDVGFDRVVVDLRRVAFIDSSGLRALLAVQAHADRSGHSLELIPGPPHVQRMFDVTSTACRFAWRAPA